MLLSHIKGKKVPIDYQLGKYVTNNILDNKNIVEIEDYYYFLISTFIIIKENIIKKDNTNGKSDLYFDYDKNKKYISLIKELALPIINSPFSYEMNKTNIIIKGNIDTFDEELPLSIWIVNKIRDSFCHGEFIIDKENKKIIINNNKTDKNQNNDYLVKVNTIYQNEEGKIIRTFKNLDFENKNTYKLTCDIPIEIIEKFVLGFDKGLKIIDNNKFERKYDKPFIFFENNEIKEFNPETENEEKIEKMKNKEEKLIEKTVSVLNIMASNIKTSKASEKDIITFLYLYNYAFMIFSSTKDEEKNNINYNLIRIQNLCIDDKLIEKINSTKYQDSCTAIQKASRRFIKDSKKIIEFHEFMENEITLEIIDKTLNKYKTKFVSQVVNKKNIVISLLRNAVMHNNIIIDGDMIFLQDKSNQNNKQAKIEMLVSIEDLRCLVEEIVGNYHYYTEQEDLKETESIINNYKLFKEVQESADNIVTIGNQIKEKKLIKRKR